ncbi:hypothetical protein Misp01_36940 [Microtetraspora sp. NBRC 13810]|uniref:SAM-dependent methyltransferase n=1 Tax=Microtetraspora sp. NBRC 13810 TaxID=3030990 RepID=UPI0024A12F95|nr:SAM-dependent methyltransferase [Microtetraspora sp. NBRC 13810]GLW08564.1 hypothetical protein Misp01_36940 [Microtetraspora sp. NBRC 13810]
MTETTPRGINPSIPSAARIYDYLLGGKDNFAADREAAERVLRTMPEARLLARHNRAFLGRAVRHCVDNGITQFIDIGAGLPTRDNTHDIASAVNPDVRVVYVDNDPIVISHGRALLEEAGRTAAVPGDVRKPVDLLHEVARCGLIDFSRPFAVLLVAVLHFVPDAAGAVEPLKEALPPGGMFVVTHGVRGEQTSREDARALQAVYRRSTTPIVERGEEEVLALFDGLRLVPPGLVPLWEWRTPEPPALDEPPGGIVGGVARKS